MVVTNSRGGWQGGRVARSSREPPKLVEKGVSAGPFAWYGNDWFTQAMIGFKITGRL